MEEDNPNFRPVKAHGRLGDRKNDGFDAEKGLYYQVYAPEDITKKNTIINGKNKLIEDFKGLYEKWDAKIPIQVFYFVINDKYKGVSPEFYDLLEEFKSEEKYKNIKFELLSSKNLERIFNSLDGGAKQRLIGHIPPEKFPILEYDALNQTVKYLKEMVNLSSLLDDNLSVPDFGEKISFNNLSQIIHSQLITASYQEGYLIQYFNDNPGVKGILQEKFRKLYVEAKNEIPDNEVSCENHRFRYILDKASINNTIAIQNAVLALMAYYFSSCDIFEEPVKE